MALAVPDASVAPPPRPRPPFREAACTGADIDLDQSLTDPACDMPREDPRWVDLTHNASSGMRGGRLVYEIKPHALHARADAPIEAQIEVTNVGATATEIGVVIGSDRGFRLEARPVAPLPPQAGGRLVEGPQRPGHPLGPNEWRLAYVRIPPGGVAHATCLAKATTTQTEHLEGSPGAPARWVVRPVALTPGTYTVLVVPPWSSESFDVRGRQGSKVTLTVEPLSP